MSNTEIRFNGAMAHARNAQNLTQDRATKEMAAAIELMALGLKEMNQELTRKVESLDSAVLLASTLRR